MHVGPGKCDRDKTRGFCDLGNGQQAYGFITRSNTGLNAMKVISGFLLLSLTIAGAGCSGSADPPSQAVVSTDTGQSAETEAADVKAMAADARLVVVHKNESCGCCHSWVEHLQEKGFKVIVRDVSNLDPIKVQVGIPYGMGSCHTARVGGYFVEGHVPAADIVRLLEERPPAKGLTVPGMPIGSPGKEVPGEPAQPYTVHLVGTDGSMSVFALHGEQVSEKD
jgi:hypothetical protein